MVEASFFVLDAIVFSDIGGIFSESCAVRQIGAQTRMRKKYAVLAQREGRYGIIFRMPVCKYGNESDLSVLPFASHSTLEANP